MVVPQGRLRRYASQPGGGFGATKMRYSARMSNQWKLKRTVQCKKCPWREGSNPREIPNGYCEAKHRALASTIAKPADLSALASGELHSMACHETHDAHCLGWVANQLGPGNNIGLRLHMLSCTNAGKIRLLGKQHPNFEATLPASVEAAPE